MILAAGLTPAWQQILSFDQFQPGEVNRAHEVHWCASGKVLNVGIAGQSMCEQIPTLTMVGCRGGTESQRELAAAEIDDRWIESGTPTRVCTTILDKSTGVTTELVEESGVPTEQALADLKRHTLKNPKTRASSSSVVRCRRECRPISTTDYCSRRLVALSSISADRNCWKRLLAVRFW